MKETMDDDDHVDQRDVNEVNERNVMGNMMMGRRDIEVGLALLDNLTTNGEQIMKKNLAGCVCAYGLAIGALACMQRRGGVVWFLVLTFILI